MNVQYFTNLNLKQDGVIPALLVKLITCPEPTHCLLLGGMQIAVSKPKIKNIARDFIGESTRQVSVIVLGNRNTCCRYPLSGGDRAERIPEKQRRCGLARQLPEKDKGHCYLWSCAGS